jgi:hypothetical protein
MPEAIRVTRAVTQPPVLAVVYRNIDGVFSIDVQSSMDGG